MTRFSRAVPALARAAALAAALAAGAALSGCATAARYDAAGDVHALLVAIRDNDKAAFDAHVDKRALKAQLETQILDRAQKAQGGDAMRALGAAFAQPLADLAGEALIRPQTFRAAAEYYGYRPGQPIPDRLTLAAALKPQGDGTVCAKRRNDGPCLMTFANEGGAWRLVAVAPDMAKVKGL